MPPCTKYFVICSKSHLNKKYDQDLITFLENDIQTCQFFNELTHTDSNKLNNLFWLQLSFFPYGSASPSFLPNYVVERRMWREVLCCFSWHKFIRGGWNMQYIAFTKPEPLGHVLALWQPNLYLNNLCVNS